MTAIGLQDETRTPKLSNLSFPFGIIIPVARKNPQGRRAEAARSGSGRGDWAIHRGSALTRRDNVGKRLFGCLGMNHGITVFPLECTTALPYMSLVQTVVEIPAYLAAAKRAGLTASERETAVNFRAATDRNRVVERTSE